MIRLLVVDDSAFMRIAISKMVEGDPRVKVVGTATDGQKAIQMAQQLRPSVITMDIEMPILNGLEAVEQIMKNAPCPIIMVSSLTKDGGDSAVKALELGAVDYIAKGSSFVQLDIIKVENELREKIYYWATHKVGGASNRDVTTSIESMQTAFSKIRPSTAVDCVAVAVSTGGPKALPEMLSKIKKLSCPMVIAQHMPKEFTPGFAESLASLTGLNVVEGYHAMPLEAGQVVIAPGGIDSRIRQPFANHLILDVKKDPSLDLHPSADHLFHSTTRNCVSPVAVILTGMGNDGSEGSREFSQRKFPVLAQEPSTCIVDGMPQSAIDSRSVSDVMSLDSIGEQLQRWCRTSQ